MFFESLRADRGCMSYLIGCPETGRAAVVDPSLDLLDRYVSRASAEGLTIELAIDTHTHADHFTSTSELARKVGAQVVMHRNSRAPMVDLHVDDGDMLVLGDVRMRVVHTPGHTKDSVCLVLDDRVLTGDTLLLGACGRTDFPGGDPGALYDSLFGKLLTLDDSLLVFPGHNYRSKPATTLAEQRATNPRLQVDGREAFIAMMSELNLSMPDHLTEALRVNLSGGKSVQQLITEASRKVVFMSLDELARRLDDRAGDGLVVLDVREGEAYAAGHIKGAKHIPRGQLELRVDKLFPNPTKRIVVYCQFGKISTLAAATLREMGFVAATALDGGFDAWQAADKPVDSGPTG